MAENIRFEWDPRKSDANLRKHGIDFEDAKRVFYDPLRTTGIEGNDHGETRWRTTGEIGGLVVVVVSHTLHETLESEEEVEIVRIISARKATRRERRRYEELT
jgi:uncharacterized DUF497 family protein